VRTSLVNAIRVNLRGNNDEELGNEVLYERLYAGHPYGTLTQGHASSVEKLTLDDVRQFHRTHFTQANLTFALAGGANAAFLKRASADIAANLPATGLVTPAIKAAAPLSVIDVTLVQKPVIAAAISMGFPIAVRRGHPDFVALYLARSYLGEHRNSSAHLFQRLREIRGMNYGDYAYTEYFPNGGAFTFPPANVARSEQAFRIWVRPVPLEQTHFAVRIAKYELDKLVREGLSQADFDASRQFLTKSTGLITARQGARLGYTLDQQFYGQKDFTAYIRDGLKTLTRDKVNAAIRRHLGGPGLAVVVVTPNAEALAKAILAETPSPMKYGSEKPPEILAEDKVIERYPLGVKPGALRIVQVGEVFERKLF
jgi:zinc protease